MGSSGRYEPTYSCGVLSRAGGFSLELREDPLLPFEREGVECCCFFLPKTPFQALAVERLTVSAPR